MNSLKGWISDPTISKAASAAAGVLALFVVFHFLKNRAVRTVQDRHNRQRVRNFFIFLAIVASIVWITTVFGEKLGRYTVALSVVGAGVAFALQEVIASMAGWLAILYSGFYRAGDRVELGRIRGDVVEIGMLRTTIMEIDEWIKSDLYTGRVVRVANSFVFKEPVFNYTGNFPYIWDEFTVPVRYDSSAEMARQILERVIADEVREFTEAAKKSWEAFAARYAIENARIEPMVTMAATDNWMQFTVRYIVDYKQRRTVKDRAFTRVVKEFDASGGKVGIASSTFQVVQPSSIDVNVRLRDGSGR